MNLKLIYKIYIKHYFFFFNIHSDQMSSICYEKSYIKKAIEFCINATYCNAFFSPSIPSIISSSYYSIFTGSYANISTVALAVQGISNFIPADTFLPLRGTVYAEIPPSHNSDVWFFCMSSIALWTFSEIHSANFTVTFSLKRNKITIIELWLAFFLLYLSPLQNMILKGNQFKSLELQLRGLDQCEADLPLLCVCGCEISPEHLWSTSHTAEASVCWPHCHGTRWRWGSSRFWTLSPS